MLIGFHAHSAPTLQTSRLSSWLLSQHHPSFSFLRTAQAQFCRTLKYALFTVQGVCKKVSSTRVLNYLDQKMELFFNCFLGSFLGRGGRVLGGPYEMVASGWPHARRTSCLLYYLFWPQQMEFLCNEFQNKTPKGINRLEVIFNRLYYSVLFAL